MAFTSTICIGYNELEGLEEQNQRNAETRHGIDNSVQERSRHIGRLSRAPATAFEDEIALKMTRK